MTATGAQSSQQIEYVKTAPIFPSLPSEMRTIFIKNGWATKTTIVRTNRDMR